MRTGCLRAVAGGRPGGGVARRAGADGTAGVAPDGIGDRRPTPGAGGALAPADHRPASHVVAVTTRVCGRRHPGNENREHAVSQGLDAANHWLSSVLSPRMLDAEGSPAGIVRSVGIDRRLGQPTTPRPTHPTDPP